MIYFTSDEHYFHDAIIEYCNRPFKDVLEMNDTIIQNHNAVVTGSDEVYHLGDFSWRGDKVSWLLQQLNGRHHLILGNHDHKHIKQAIGSYAKGYKMHMFQSVRDVAIVSWNGDKIFVSHYAHACWPASHKGRGHLFGHSHGTFPGIGRSFDVGVDALNFEPISFPRAWNRLYNLPVRKEKTNAYSGLFRDF